MRKILTVFLLMAFSHVALTAQIDIYVSQETGDDANDGATWATAYKTIDKALDQPNGNTGIYNIYLAQGNYILEDNNNNGGNNNNEYRYGTGQNINIYGGYPIPYEETLVAPTANAEVYTTTLYTGNNAEQTSAFRFVEGSSNVSLLIQDLTILDTNQGSVLHGSFLTFDGVGSNNTNSSSFTMENVTIDEWGGGSGGFVYVYNSRDVKFTVNKSLIQRSSNDDADGQLIRVNEGCRNVDILMTDSIVRNVTGNGERASIFYIFLNCNEDEGESSLEISGSEFLNIKRGRLNTHPAAVITARRLPYLKLYDNIFEGNAGGLGGVIQFDESGEFRSELNLYQDNFAGQVGGAVWIRDTYPCANPEQAVTNMVEFKNDKFISNKSGYTNEVGRGGAIYMANQTGVNSNGSTNKPLRVIDSEFIDNRTAARPGGAIYTYTSEDVLIQNSVFCNNQANRDFLANPSGGGGAIYARGAGNLTVNNSAFNNNSAEESGGAIHSTMTGDVLINGCSYFEGNRAENSGGAFHTNNYNTLTIDGATFKGNFTEIADGGALDIRDGVNSVNILNVVFEDNFSDNLGGAIWTQSAATLTDVDFINNKSNNNGGAIFAEDNMTITGAKFSTNKSLNDNGGAIYANASAEIVINNADFTGNTAIVDGGAIYADQYVEVTNATFTENETQGDGGAIALVENRQLNFELVNFIRNKAGSEGGALYLVTSSPSTASASVNFTQAYFEGNEAISASSNSNQGQGGAMYLEGYGITTGDANTAVGNVIFKDNKASNQGGAISLDKPGNQDILLYAGRYINNDGGKRGGAIYSWSSGGSSSDHHINNNEFVNNEADEKGGAIAIVDRQSNEMDQMNGNKFWMNTLNGSVNNSTSTQRSDIYLDSPSIGNYDARINQFNDNFLQFTASTQYYPNDGTQGYNLGTGNVQQNSSNNPPSTTASAFTTTSTSVTACTKKDCAPKEDTPFSPVIVSTADLDGETNVNSGNIEDYASYTIAEAVPNTSCVFYNTEVAFSARSNNAPNDQDVIVPNTTPELRFTYKLIKTNRLTGEYTSTTGNIMNSTLATRVEDPSDEIPTGEVGNLPRSIYKSYFLNVTDDLQPGYNFTYEITAIEELDGNGNAVKIFDYTTSPHKFVTEVVADFCPCIIGVLSDASNVKSTDVGISTLDRNTDEWLSANNKQGAYIILESTTKGFVVPRYSSSADVNAIGDVNTPGVEEGMIVWDADANCLKMFYDDSDADDIPSWNCISDTTCTNTTP